MLPGMLKRLPLSDRVTVLDALRKQVDGVRIGEDEQDAGGSLWDRLLVWVDESELATANKLDAIYQAVADRTAEVAEKAKEAASDAVSAALPTGLLLLAGAMVVYMVLREAKR